MILKHYANLSFGQTHYRRAGSGAPLVLLHASPMSSATMLPMMQRLTDKFDVIAPDTPGYGNSDPLPDSELKATADLSPYVQWLSEYLDVMRLNEAGMKIGLYGTATGAQIAIEFARAHPDKLAYLILDNAAHFTDQQRDFIMRDYFPEISPKADGSHLQQVWNMAGGLFQWFPWYAQDEQHRISEVEPPTELVHATAMAYLTAGTDYAEAYKRAFHNEDARRVSEVIVPVRLIRWDGSVIKQYVDAYDQFEWPPHIQMRHCSGDVEQRFETIEAAVSEFS